MEEWKKRQGDKLQVVKHEGHDGGNFGGDDLDDSELPMYGSKSTLCFPQLYFYKLNFYPIIEFETDSCISS